MKKQQYVESLIKKYCKVEPIIGMENPFNYRNKVHAVFATAKRGEIVSGEYEQGSHRGVPVESCRIEDEKADAIIRTIRSMLKSFKIPVFNEDTKKVLRHELIRTGYKTGEILVVLVLASPVFPSKNNFIKALLNS